VYGGVPAVFLVRIATFSGFLQRARFMFTLLFTSLAGRFAGDIFEQDFSGIDTWVLLEAKTGARLWSYR